MWEILPGHFSLQPNRASTSVIGSASGVLANLVQTSFKHCLCLLQPVYYEPVKVDIRYYATYILPNFLVERPRMTCDLSIPSQRSALEFYLSISKQAVARILKSFYDDGSAHLRVQRTGFCGRLCGFVICRPMASSTTSCQVRTFSSRRWNCRAIG